MYWNTRSCAAQWSFDLPTYTIPFVSGVCSKSPLPSHGPHIKSQFVTVFSVFLMISNTKYSNRFHLRSVAIGKFKSSANFVVWLVLCSSGASPTSSQLLHFPTLLHEFIIIILLIAFHRRKVTSTLLPHISSCFTFLLSFAIVIIDKGHG